MSSALRPCDAAWACVPAALLIALVLCAVGGLVDSAPAGAALGICACASVAVMLRRRKLIERFDALPPAARAVRDVLALALAAVCGFLSLELPWNTELIAADAGFMRFELCFIALGVAALYFLAHRHGALAALGVAVLLVIGLAEYFVLLFKGCVFLPRDLYALDTAATVAGNYRYGLSANALSALIAALVAFTVLGLVVPKGSSRPHMLLSWPADLAKGLVLALACTVFVATPDYEEMGVELNYWYIIQCFQKQCFVPTFAAAVQDMGIDAPDGYSAQGALRVQADLAAEYDEAHSGKEQDERAVQFAEKKPSVVVVMNESFADLSVMGDLGCGYSGPEYFNSDANGATAKGPVAVSAFGGGTANTEFEILTGSSLVSVGSGKYPFQMYHLDAANSIAKQFADLGYHTSAMHPNMPGNWRRKEVYPELGFERFYSIDDFEGCPVYHNGVSDEATYDKALEILQESDEPQFIFDVTMQNHGGYTMGNTPAGKLHGVKVKGFDDAYNAQVDEYLACIDESDRALEEFVGKLQELDEPVVLVFFGDHHPLFSRDVNDAECADSDECEHMQRVQQTVYGIWANYDVAGSGGQGAGGEGEAVSSSSLGAYALQEIGAPLDEHQKAVLASRSKIRQIDVFGYRGDNGKWYYYGQDGPYLDALGDFCAMEYLNFGTRLG